MTRTLTLEPTFTKGRNKPWQVWIPASLSDTGKTKRLFFKTKREAQTAADLVKTRADNFGRQANVLSPARMTIAAEAFSVLEGRPDVALLEIVQAGLATERERAASVTWSNLVDEFLATKQGRSSNHRRNLRYTRERFAHLDDRKVSDITAADLSPTLDSLAPSSRNLKLSHLKSIFTYAKKRGWTFTNPAEKIDVAQIARAEVEIFAAAQVESLLTYALHDDPGLISYFTFGFFCGIRPDGELLKLDWSCVHFTGDKAEVEIPPDVSKTKRRRFVDLSENALAWLEAHRKAGGAVMGPLIAHTPAMLRRRRRRASLATGIRWTRNGMRHSYCSAWLAIYKDVNRLVLMSGHDDPDTLWRFYHRGMSEKQAARFWAIVPDTSTSKIISFHGSA